MEPTTAFQIPAPRQPIGGRVGEAPLASFVDITPLSITSVTSVIRSRARRRVHRGDCRDPGDAGALQTQLDIIAVLRDQTTGFKSSFVITFLLIFAAIVGAHASLGAARASIGSVDRLGGPSAEEPDLIAFHPRAERYGGLEQLELSIVSRLMVGRLLLLFATPVVQLAATRRARCLSKCSVLEGAVEEAGARVP